MRDQICIEPGMTYNRLATSAMTLPIDEIFCDNIFIFSDNSW